MIVLKENAANCRRPVRQWDTQLGPHWEYISAYFHVGNQPSKDPSRQPPDPCESKAIVHAKDVDLLRNSIRAFDIKRHLTAIFDYLDDIAFAYVHNISDKPALKAEASPFLFTYYEFFENFIVATNAEGKADYWPSLTEVVKEWKPEDIKPEPTPCP